MADDTVTNGATSADTINPALCTSTAAAVNELVRGLSSLQQLLLVLEGLDMAREYEGAGALVDGALAAVGRLGVLADRTARGLHGMNGHQSDAEWLGLPVAIDGGAA